jgi:hypothetical protein
MSTDAPAADAPAADALAFVRDINADVNGFYLPLSQGLRRRGLPLGGDGLFLEVALAETVAADALLAAAAARLREVADGSLTRERFRASFAEVFAAFAA